MIYTDEQLASEFLGAHRFRGNEVNRDDMGDWLSVVRRAKELLQPTVVFASKAEDGSVEVAYSNGELHIIKPKKPE